MISSQHIKNGLCALLIGLLSSFSPIGFAQKIREFNFSHYSTANGLLSNQLNSVVQDDEGYIWAGTTDGLQRFDGTRYRSFRTRLDKGSLLYTLRFNNECCDMQALNNLLQSREPGERLNAIKATLKIEVHKSNSVIVMKVPIA